MGFNRERIGAECRPISNVGYRVEAFGSYPRARNVHAVHRYKFFVAAEINGGDGIASAETTPASWRGEYAERPSQKLPRTAYIALLDELANAAAGDRFPPDAHFRIDLYVKSQLSPKLGKQLYVAFRLVSETEVEALMHLADATPVFQNF